MDNKIHYLNTDLDVWSPNDLGGMAARLAERGVRSLHVTQLDDGSWYATFEHDESYDEPEKSIEELLTAIKGLPPEDRATWMGCTRREFNIGYDCGAEPWEFNQLLSNGLLERLVRLGGAVRITLYPDRSESEAKQGTCDAERRG